MTDDPGAVALRILSRISGVDGDRISPESDLVSDLGIDSPKALQLLVDLEDALDMEIGDEAAARIRTVGDILDLVGAT